MANILCLSDSNEDVLKFVGENNLYFFKIKQLPSIQHRWSFFKKIYTKLKEVVDLNEIDLVIAEFIESLPLLYFIRKDGFFFPAIMIPHTNPYPLNILTYFILISEYAHPEDTVLCGSTNAVDAYKKLVNINARNITTFGLKDIFTPIDKQLARVELGLPQNAKILLYTGRFAEDKGLDKLIRVYDEIRKHEEAVCLVCSITHITPDYYNRLAPKLKNAIVFYRMQKNKMSFLYSAADLYIAPALSIFETYGKSPLEAIACGTPALLPKWDGFTDYINNNNGMLADVVYDIATNKSSSFCFAEIDTDDFLKKSLELLNSDKEIQTAFPPWAYYNQSMERIRELITDLLEKQPYAALPHRQIIDTTRYPKSVRNFLNTSEIKTIPELIRKSEPLLTFDMCGESDSLKAIHDDIFKP